MGMRESCWRACSRSELLSRLACVGAIDLQEKVSKTHMQGDLQPKDLSSARNGPASDMEKGGGGGHTRGMNNCTALPSPRFPLNSILHCTISR